MSIPNFYTGRLQQSLGSDGNFFGAYVYHKPIKNASGAYQTAYEAFDTQFNSAFVPVYKKLALYIIRQSTALASSKNPLLKGTVINDLFFMNNKAVPASAIMSKLDDENFVTSSFTLMPAEGGTYYDSTKDLDELFLSNYSGYASYAKIRYSITLKYSAILNSAYNAS